VTSALLFFIHHPSPSCKKSKRKERERRRGRKRASYIRRTIKENTEEKERNKKEIVV